MPRTLKPILLSTTLTKTAFGVRIITTLLHWANALNRSVPAFKEAQRLLEGDDSVIGRVIRQAGSQGFGVFMKP